MTTDWLRPGEVDRKHLAAISAVLTALTITGAVVLVFTVLGSSMTLGLADLPLWLAIPLGVLVLSLAFVVGGGVWGWGMAALFDQPRWPAAKTGALAITGMFTLLEIPVHFTQALPVPDWMPLGIHGGFTLVFAIEIALVAGVAATRLAKRLGVDQRRLLGTKVGLTGAAGTVIGSLLALGLGFKVGQPPPFTMVWALCVVVAVAGLTAGWAFGWLLTNHEQKRADTQDSRTFTAP